MLSTALIPRHVLLWVSAIVSTFLVVLIASSLSTATKSHLVDKDIVSTRISYFIDESSAASFEYVKQNAVFMPVSSAEDIPWRLRNRTYWIKMDINYLGLLSKDVQLVIDNSTIDHFALYRVVDGAIQKRWLLTDTSEQGVRNMPLPPSVALSLEPNKRNYYLIEIVSNGLSNTPLWLMEPKGFQTVSLSLHLLWGGFIAFVFGIALYSSGVYIYSRDKVYLLYVAYVLTALVQISAIHGFGRYLFPHGLHAFFSENAVTLTFLVMLQAISFTYFYLNLRQHSIMLRQIIQFGMAVLALLSVFALIMPEYIAARFLLAVQLPFYGLIGFLTLQRWEHGERWVRLFLVSWVPSLIAGIFPAMLAMGAMAYTLETRYAFMLGSALTMVFFSLSLAERFRHRRAVSMFNLTHDSISGLPNANVLRLSLARLIESNTPFSFCTYRIDTFDSLAPYIGEVEKRNYVKHVVDKLNNFFDSDDVREIEPEMDEEPKRLAAVRENVFGFIVKEAKPESCELLLSNAAEDLDGYIPLKNFVARVKGSIGISCFPHDGETPETLINHALQALEQIQPGGSRVQHFNSVEHHNRTMNMSLVADLKRAIDQDLLQLFHQPQIDMRTGSVHGSEVLLRWEHPKYGAISPDVFVRLAEDVGMINDLTLWVIRRALKQQQKLIEHGFCRRLSINISASDIVIPNLVPRLVSMAEEYDVPTNLISLELTESAMVEDYNRLKQLINDLSSSGIEVSIDDYGTGYSSLHYLSQLPFTELKIDRSFISNLSTSTRKQNIVRATTEMAKSLGVMVVAEGVEELDVEVLLKRYGVDVAQGYFYSRPLSFNQYLLYLKRSQKQLPTTTVRKRQVSN